jgi:hypothetical protein
MTRAEKLYDRMKERLGNKGVSEVSVMIKGAKEMFGDEDIIDHSARQYSCVCIKAASVYCIDKHVGAM